MIRDHAATLVRLVAGSVDDPFLVADLGKDQIPQLASEAASLPLTGGRRVVRLREATDAATDPVAAILKGGAPALVVLEGPGLDTIAPAQPAGGSTGRRSHCLLSGRRSSTV